MNQATVFTAPDVVVVEKEVIHLRVVDAKNDDLSVLWPDLVNDQEFGYVQQVKPAQGIAWGVTVGGALGALQAYLITTGVMWSPCSTQLNTVGPLFAILAGVAVGGTAGYLIGLTLGLAMPIYEAKKCERNVKMGSKLISVPTAERNVMKITTTLLALLAIVTCGRALAQDSTTIAPSVAPKIDAKISPQAKIDAQKANMPPDTTSVKALDKSQDKNLNATDQVKVDKALDGKKSDSSKSNSKKNSKHKKEK